MPIEIKSKIDYREVAKELNVPYELLMELANDKNIYDFKKETTEGTIIDLINSYIDHLNLLVQTKRRSYFSVKTYRSFLERLKEFIISKDASMSISKLNENLFNEFIIRTLPCDVKDRTINTYTAILKAMLSYAHDIDYTKKNLSFRFTIKDVTLLPRYIPDSVVKEVIDASLQRRNGYRCHAIINFLLGTGVRVSELVNARVNEFNIDNNLLYVKGKRKKERYIPIYPEVKEVTLDYLYVSGVKEWKRDNNGYLFARDYGDTRNHPLSIRSVQDMIHKIFVHLDCKNEYTVHSFRHTFAVRCLQAGMREAYLQEILGHDDPKTTAIYTKLFPKDLHEEVMKNYPFPFENLINQVILNRGEKDEES